MKKIVPIVLIIVYIICVLGMTYFDFGLGNAVTISLIFIVILFIALFESKSMDSKTMSVLAILSALGGVLRIPCAVIPGFNPVTFICAIAGYTYGPVNGFMIGSMSAFISNFFLGHGPWTLWQMLGWGLCGVFFGIFRKIIKKFGFKGFVICCTIWGYVYGFILNQWYIINYFRPITLEAILAGSISSFGHDTLHAIGNFMFSMMFGKNFIKVLERYKSKSNIKYLDVEEKNSYE